MQTGLSARPDVKLHIERGSAAFFFSACQVNDMLLIAHVLPETNISIRSNHYDQA